MDILLRLVGCSSAILLLTACATKQPTPQPTLIEIQQNRIAYLNACMGHPDAFARLLNVENAENADGEALRLCAKKMEMQHPIPPAVSGRKVARDCMRENGIPTADENPDYKPPPEKAESQMADFMSCMENAGKYQPIDLD